MNISQLQRLPAFRFERWKEGGAVLLAEGNKDRILAQVDYKFWQLRRLILWSLEPYETEIPAVRKLALRFLGQAIARFSPNYLRWLEVVTKLCALMILDEPSSTEDVWLYLTDGGTYRVKYRVMIWPDIAVFVPRTKRTFDLGDAPLVEISANRLLNEDASTRGIRKRFLLMGSSAGEEWWRDCSASEIPYGRAIPAMKVCALVASEVAISKGTRDVAAWYLQKAPAVELWGKRAIANAGKKQKTPLIEDIYAVLTELG